MQTAKTVSRVQTLYSNPDQKNILNNIIPSTYLKYKEANSTGIYQPCISTVLITNIKQLTISKTFLHKKAT
jgi:hypothetical protein